jgi:hypothetical protein
MLGKVLMSVYLALPILLAIIFTICSVVRLRRTTRWPIPQKLLRSPGESLRKKLERIDEGALLHFCIVMLIWLGCLEGLLKLQLAVAPRSWFVFFAILGVCSVLAVVGAWWLNRYMSNRANYALGFYGERAVGEEINQLMLNGCHVFHDFPADPKWNIDHIIVAPSGVHVVETKTRR